MSSNLSQGLVEAYKSIYINTSVDDQITTVEEIEEDFEINEENLCESIENYLIFGGFAETHQQAHNMLPHLSEEWFNDISSTIIISEQILNCLVESGKELEEITGNDLYEFCMSENITLIEASVNFGQLANLVSKAKSAATSPATRQAATGLLQTGQRAVTQTAGPVLSGVTRRVTSAAQTGQQAVQQATQAAGQGPKGPIGQTLGGIKRGLELATGAKPGSGSRIRRSLMVGGTGGLLGSTGLGQKALETLGRIRVSLADGKPKEEKPKQAPKPAPKPESLPGFE